jgi:hypothetical protein
LWAGLLFEEGSRQERNFLGRAPTSGGEALGRVAFRSVAEPEAGVFLRSPQSGSGARDADVRASPVVFEVADMTLDGRKSSRKSAHLDFCEPRMSGSPQCRKRFHLFLGRRRIDAMERRGSLASIRRHETAAAKKPH